MTEEYLNQYQQYTIYLSKDTTFEITEGSTLEACSIAYEGTVEEWNQIISNCEAARCDSNDFEATIVES